MLGQLRESDLEACSELVPDANPTAGAQAEADATNRGEHVACQEAQIALLTIVRKLVKAGVLVLVK